MFKKDKGSKEFFEIFKNPQQKEGIKHRGGVSQKEQATPSIIPKPVIENSQKTQKEETKNKRLDWIKNTRSGETFQTGDRNVRKLFLNEVVFKQETLILAALGAAILSTACFFTGYKIGYNKALSPEILQESLTQPKMSKEVKSIPPGKEIKAVDLSKKTSITTNKKKQNVKWTLQIITYSNNKKNVKKATNLAKAIKDMTGYSTFVAKRGKELVVCVGKFDSKNNTEMKNILAEISSLEYEGKKQFAGSYPIQIR
ncbi:MAG: hypothetical protein ACE5KZ_10915 [Candidatus Scalinduaceae bacterium]